MSIHHLAVPHRRNRLTQRNLIGFVIVLGLSAPVIASYLTEHQWWLEMQKVPTWISVMLYTILPVVVATLLTFAVLVAFHGRGMKFAGRRLREQERHANLSAAIGLLVAPGFAGIGIPSAVWILSVPPTFCSMLHAFGPALAVWASVVDWLQPAGGNSKTTWQNSSKANSRSVLSAGEACGRVSAGLCAPLLLKGKGPRRELDAIEAEVRR